MHQASPIHVALTFEFKRADSSLNETVKPTTACLEEQ